MADYSFTPQFANLTGLQPLPAVDVTRGGALQFQPLQAIEVASARPELVGQSIAGAIQNIAGGALSGITAKYEEKKAAEREQLAHEREMELYGAKKRSENQDFYERQRAAFIAENSQRIDFPEKLAAFDSAYSGYSDRLPEIQQKEKHPVQPITTPEIVDTELPTQAPLTADFVSVPEEIPQERVGTFGFTMPTRGDLKALEAVESTVTPQEAEAPLGALTAPEPIVETTPPPIAGVPQQPEDQTAPRNVPSKEFKTESEASNVAFQINQTSTTSQVVVKQNPNTGGYAIVQKPSEEIEKETREARAEQREAEKLDIARAKEAREKAESEQKMEIDAQKKKDAPAILWKAAEDNGLLLKEINLILNTIEEDESVLGPGGYAMSLAPMTKSREIRDSLDTIISKMTLGSLQNLREASPTGGALGNVSDKDITILRDAAGKINLNSGRVDTVKAKLKDFKRKFEVIQNKLVNDPNWDVDQYPVPVTEWGIQENPQKFTPISEPKSKAPTGFVQLISPQGVKVFSPQDKVDYFINQRGYTKAE